MGVKIQVEMASLGMLVAVLSSEQLATIVQSSNTRKLVKYTPSIPNTAQPDEGAPRSRGSTSVK
jgi:hypothetical protein